MFGQAVTNTKSFIKSNPLIDDTGYTSYPYITKEPMYVSFVQPPHMLPYTKLIA